MSYIRIFEHLTTEEKAIIKNALEERAPDLLRDLNNGVPLSPGPRLRLDDLLDDYAMDAMTPDYKDTPESRAVGPLMGKLRKLQPTDLSKLKIHNWTKGDPIPRGMARYEEIEESDSGSEGPRRPV